MDCPKCGKQMEKGFLRSKTGMNWVSDSKTTQNPYEQFSDRLDISKLSLMQLPAYQCLICHRIEINLEELPKDLRFCSNCGLNISSSDEICPRCGSKVQLTLDKEFLCKNCKNPVKADDILCPSCGAELDKFAIDLLNTCVECGYSDPSLEDLAECPKCGAILPI